MRSFRRLGSPLKSGHLLYEYPSGACGYRTRFFVKKCKKNLRNNSEAYVVEWLHSCADEESGIHTYFFDLI